METIIELKDITKRFIRQRTFCLKGVSLRVLKHEFLCIVGPSGCGKTVLARIMAGLEKPTSGQVIYKEQVLKGVTPAISMVFQTPALLPWLTVKENIEFGLNMRGGPNWMEKHKIEGYMAMVRLTEHFDRYPRELSGGMRQRAAIARALAENPDVLILDEPFSQIDLVAAEELRSDILNIWEYGRTIIMIPHNLEDAVELADRIAVMGDGIIQEMVFVDLPRPRRRDSVEFMEKVKKINEILTKNNESV